ncbi:MAG: Holliday junction branch migration protein RuvA [Bacteroidetes bacterium]|nr:Holliday junction branch migration protein RuvA [Bacteroidota bacterium]
MITFVKGNLIEKNPAYIVVDCSGIGYFINISLQTYSQIPDSGEVKVYTHFIVREDAHSLYGFATKAEKDLFGHLISVSGVGPNTARMILSSMSAAEIKSAIVNNNTSALQNIKGIGSKSAQRIIVDLKDKLEKEGVERDENFKVINNTIQEEALSALVMLGFAKNSALKVIESITKKGHNYTVEELIKEALRSF